MLLVFRPSRKRKPRSLPHPSLTLPARTERAGEPLMSVAVRCPNPSCAVPLQLPGGAAAVRCPRCGQTFRVAAPAEAVTRDLPPDDGATRTLGEIGTGTPADAAATQS